MRVLQLLAEGRSNRAVAETLVESDAMNPALALQEVQAIAKRYGGKT